MNREEELDVEVEEENFAHNLFNEYDNSSDIDDDSDNDSESNDSSSAKFGLKSKCVFNQLKTFHAVTSMPPDSMMEGKKRKNNF